MRLWSALGIILLVAGATAHSQAPVVPADVMSHITKRVAYGYTPGIVVGMINSNGAAYFSHGVRDLDTGSPVNEDSVFEIGSITKTFTCTVLSQLLLDGSMVLTNPVKAYLPEEVLVPSRGGKLITLQHLATHRSGLPRMPTNLKPASILDPFSDYTVQMMYDFLSTYQLPRDPGALFEYSNFGVGLLGHVLSLRTALDYETLIAERITRPLGMSDTGVTLTSRMAANLARGHSGVIHVPNWDLGPALPGAGALRASVRDLLRYMAANMGLFQTDLYPAMTNAHAVRVGAFPGTSIGLGWFSTPISGDQIIWHDGGTGGYRSYAGFLRNRKIGVVVLSNSDYGAVEIGQHLLNSGLALPPLRAPIEVDVNTLRSYVGHFRGSGGDYFDIGLQRDHLTLAYSGDQGMSFTLYPSATRSFYLTIVEGSGRFTTNSLGEVASFIWTQSGQSTTYTKTALPARLAIKRRGAETEIAFTGDTAVDYVLEATSDFVAWKPISTNTIWTLPAIDKEPASARFYRLRRQ